MPSNIEDVLVVMYDCSSAAVHQISGIDLKSRRVTLKTPFNAKARKSCTGNRYFFENMKEALNRSGLFYLERRTNQLSYFAHPGEDPNNLTVVIPRLITLLRMQGEEHPVQNLVFENIQFSHALEETDSCFRSSCDGASASFLSSAAINISNSRFITFNSVEVSDVGGYGIWLGERSTDCLLNNSSIRSLGAGGVRVGLPIAGVVEDSKRVQRILINNSRVTDGGHFYQSSSGVLVQAASEVQVLHCEISRFLSSGLSLGWSTGYDSTTSRNNLVAYNHVFDIGNRTLSEFAGIETMGH